MTAALVLGAACVLAVVVRLIVRAGERKLAEARRALAAPDHRAWERIAS